LQQLIDLTSIFDTIMDEQEKMRNARTSGEYTQIWQSTGKCVFCDLKDKYIIHEENGIALTINLYPYVDGQMMAIPRKHISSPKELTALEWDTMRKFNYLSKKLMKKVFGYKGMWSLIREGGENAQMSVTDHLHMQFIPFEKADLCTWSFQELKHTPIENAELYKQQSKELKDLAKKFEKKYTG
jgi:diadenosine tetraphosphate (Ap4A) HIT family hydrolase